MKWQVLECSSKHQAVQRNTISVTDTDCTQHSCMPSCCTFPLHTKCSKHTSISNHAWQDDYKIQVNTHPYSRQYEVKQRADACRVVWQQDMITCTQNPTDQFFTSSFISLLMKIYLTCKPLDSWLPARSIMPFYLHSKQTATTGENSVLQDRDWRGRVGLGPEATVGGSATIRFVVQAINNALPPARVVSGSSLQGN